MRQCRRQRPHGNGAGPESISAACVRACVVPRACGVRVRVRVRACLRSRALVRGAGAPRPSPARESLTRMPHGSIADAWAMVATATGKAMAGGPSWWRADGGREPARTSIH